MAMSETIQAGSSKLRLIVFASHTGFV